MWYPPNPEVIDRHVVVGALNASGVLKTVLLIFVLLLGPLRDLLCCRYSTCIVLGTALESGLVVMQSM